MLMFSLDFSAELAKSYTNVAFAPSIVRPAPSTAEARVAPLATVMFASVTSNVAVLIVVVVPSTIRSPLILSVPAASSSPAGSRTISAGPDSLAPVISRPPAVTNESAVAAPVTVTPDVVALILSAPRLSISLVESTTAYEPSPLRNVVASAVPVPRFAGSTIPERLATSRSPTRVSAARVPLMVTPVLVACALICPLSSFSAVESTSFQVPSPLRNVVPSATPAPKRAVATVPDVMLEASISAVRFCAVMSPITVRSSLTATAPAPLPRSVRFVSAVLDSRISAARLLLNLTAPAVDVISYPVLTTRLPFSCTLPVPPTSAEGVSSMSPVPLV